MRRILFLISLLLFSVSAFSENALTRIGIDAPTAGYRDSTKYRPLIIVPGDTTHYKRQSNTQDKIFVFFEKKGLLEAQQPKGYAVHFTWYKLDTANLTFNKIWADTVAISSSLPTPTPFSQLTLDSSRCNSALSTTQTTYSTARSTSKLPDSLTYGCYRVVTDTLQAVYDEVHCDSFCYAIGNDTLYVDTTLYIPQSYNIVAADTFNAWVVIDTFHIDTILVASQDCEYLSLQTRFHPNGVSGDYFWYYWYRYLDLWQTPNKVWRNFPDCSDCYLKKVEWTTPGVDIYKDVDMDIDQSWKTFYDPYIPTPFYDAKYKVEITNYFGQKDTMSTGIIKAISTYAKMKLFIQKTENGIQDWVEKNDESAEEAPAIVKLVNTSINSNNESSTFTWSLFSNLYEQDENVRPEDVPLIVPQIITHDSAEAVYPAQYDPTLYQPGKYPIALYVSNRYGCFSSDTIMLEVDEFLINKDAIPTVFTPNGDGKNDEFKLKDPDQNVKSLESIEINIFNRYGQLMYTGSDVLFSWDGKMRGTNTMAPDGVYFYVLKAQGFDKQRKVVRQSFKGNVHLFNGK